MTNGIGLATPGDTQHDQINITPSPVTGVDALHALERLYGTAGLENAIHGWQADHDVRARLNFLHADENAQQVIDAINRARRLGDDELADMIETSWKASPPPPVAEPLPPLTLAVAQ